MCRRPEGELGLLFHTYFRIRTVLSAPEPKAQVFYSDHAFVRRTSSVRRR